MLNYPDHFVIIVLECNTSRVSWNRLYLLINKCGKKIVLVRLVLGAPPCNPAGRPLGSDPPGRPPRSSSLPLSPAGHHRPSCSRAVRATVPIMYAHGGRPPASPYPCCAVQVNSSLPSVIMEQQLVSRRSCFRDDGIGMGFHLGGCKKKNKTEQVYSARQAR